MADEPDIRRVATLLADPARATIVRTLIDGTRRPAGELAYAANVSAHSAGAHLARLVESGLLEVEAQGRHRYYRVADAKRVSVIEGMVSNSAAARPRAPRSALPPGSPSVRFRHARTCHGHLAGEMGVKVLQAMLEARWLTAEGRDFTVTALGETKLAALDVDLASARSPQRVFARACVDLTERRPHLGGALGKALLEACVGRGWIRRERRSRAVTVTPRGAERFRRWFRT